MLEALLAKILQYNYSLCMDNVAWWFILGIGLGFIPVTLVISIIIGFLLRPLKGVQINPIDNKVVPKDSSKNLSTRNLLLIFDVLIGGILVYFFSQIVFYLTKNNYYGLNELLNLVVSCVLLLIHLLIPIFVIKSILSSPKNPEQIQPPINLPQSV